MKSRTKALILFSLGVLISIAVYAATSYQVNVGYKYTILAFTVCKEIKNAGTKPLFVPANTSGEWSAMYTNPPAGVTATTTADSAPSNCCTKACNVAF